MSIWVLLKGSISRFDKASLAQLSINQFCALIHAPKLEYSRFMSTTYFVARYILNKCSTLQMHPSFLSIADSDWEVPLKRINESSSKGTLTSGSSVIPWAHMHVHTWYRRKRLNEIYQEYFMHCFTRYTGSTLGKFRGNDNKLKENVLHFSS